MRRAPATVLGLLLLSAGLATSPSHSEELKDLYFGEALYYAHQGYYFEALERLEAGHARAARVVLLRFFGGLSLPEAAELTVTTGWSVQVHPPGTAAAVFRPFSTTAGGPGITGSVAKA